MGCRKAVIGALAILSIATVASESQAADCTLPANKVIVAGSTAIEPLLKNASAALAAMGDIAIYSAGGGSCAGSLGFVAGTELQAGVSIKSWDATGAAVTCTLAAPIKPDLAVSDVFLSSCGTTMPAGFADTQGPIVPMLYVVPRLSQQKGLTAEEGYFVFGFGTAGFSGMTVAPWTDQTKFIIRDKGSGTQQMTARGVLLPSGDVMKGTNGMSSGGVVTMLKAANASAATAEPAIGILGADIYDANRADLKALFFQGKGQLTGYLPDSTSTSFDKRNVRDGKYVVWGPEHFITAAGTDGKASDARVQALLDYLTLAKPLGTAKVLDNIIDAKFIPQCAMKVKRTSEVGDMTPWTPEAGTACGCYMEEKIQAGSSKCTACTMDAMCTGGKKCSNGFCE
jgi:ABC-type phosphate transport system substrate-binding protein